jgi:hypothetical protein
MSKKRKVPPAPVAWTPFEAFPPIRNEKARDLDPDVFDKMTQEFEDGVCILYANSKYHVHLRFLEGAGNLDGWIHLSIRHNDRRAVRDWRQFQRIKNELVGEEREAMEIYPAESRLVDEANSYHLWVMPAGQQVPVGFNEGRMVGTSADATKVGARQRNTPMAKSNPPQPEGASTR